MKGKLILQSITEPKEGMQVYWKNDDNVPKKIWKIQHVTEHGIGLEWMYTELVLPNELSQIAVDYKQLPARIIDPRKPLPLHPSDWEWAIKHIGEEVEFEHCIIPQLGFSIGKPLNQDGAYLKSAHSGVSKLGTGPGTNRAAEKIANFAERYNNPAALPKLNQPKTYTEEEVRTYCSMAWFNGISNKDTFVDWWELNKKK